MKIKLIIIFLLFAFQIHATTYYVRTDGNNANTGTSNSSGGAWLTLTYASLHTSSTDIIHIVAGLYTEASATINIPVGVSIEGDGVTSILRSSITADFTPFLQLSSAEGTNGNQHISNLKFEGQFTTGSTGTDWGIYVSGRSNVAIHDITMIDFRDRGIIFGGRNDNSNAAPTIYATGNTLYNCTITNCSQYNHSLTYGAGCVNIGGQDGMLIHDNTITQDSRPLGYNGWPIKYYNDGYLNGCRIYKNTLNHIQMTNTSGGDQWDFAIELTHESGIIIDSNTLKSGSIDLNFQTKGAYAYGAWIHNNYLYEPVENTYLQFGIHLEFGTNTAIIENNIFDKKNLGISLIPRLNDTVKNITIRKNLMFGISIAEGTGYAINMNSGGTNRYDSIDIYNNTMLVDGSNSVAYGIGLPPLSSGYIKHINIRNNIISNCNNTWLSHGGSVVADSVTVTHNNAYGNGNSNNPVYVVGTPTNYTASNLTTTTVTFATNYTLPGGSSMIDAGINVGLPFTGTAPDIGYWEVGDVVPNLPPSVNAGSNQTITLQKDSVLMSGSATDDGSVSSNIWTQISGPNTANIISPTSYNTLIKGLIAGTYVFRLTAIDNTSLSSYADMTVSVNPQPDYPSVNAGADQSISATSVTLNGTASGNPGSTNLNLLTYSEDLTNSNWIKNLIDVTANKKNDVIGNLTLDSVYIQTSAFDSYLRQHITGLTGGTTYYLKMDGENGTSPKVSYGVYNISTGSDLVVDSRYDTSLNSSTATRITRSFTLPMGSSEIYLQIVEKNSTIGNLYLGRVQLTPNSGDSYISTVSTAVTSPTSSTSITTYSWIQISGASATIVSPSSATTNITGLSAGTYVFRLTVTDNLGTTAYDDLIVTVTGSSGFNLRGRRFKFIN